MTASIDTTAAAAAKARENVIIFDTTMRDGEQSPGASMSLDEKLELAKILEEMGVDVIEAGFPIASNGDFEAVREIAKIVKTSTIAGLCRAHQVDIDRCAEALKPAARGRIHVVIATSDLRPSDADILAALPAFLAEYRTGILAPSAYAADGSVTAVIGTGAFRVTKLEPPMTLEAERFDAYWGGAAKVPAVHYTSATRAETRALMAEAGDAELVVNLDPASVTRLQSVADVTVHSVAMPRVLLLKLNTALPFFDTVEERQALSLAIDRAGLAQAVLRYPAAASQLLPPAVGGWHNAALPPLDHDPEAAKAAFAAAGWLPGADGILEKDGQRFTVELLTYPDRPELPLTAAVLEQLFREVGIAVTINATNSSEIPAKHAAGTLQMALFARNFGLVPDPVGTFMQDYAPGGDWGAMGWENDAFTAAVRKMAAEGGSDAEKSALAATLQAELPVLPIAWYQQTAAVSHSVKGIIIDPYERTYGLKSAEFAE